MSREAPTPATTSGLARLRNWTVLLGGVWLVLQPVFGALNDDSFPLSNYPMFAEARGRPKMAQIVGLDSSDARHRLTPELLGSSEVLQAKALVERAANGGAKQRSAYCASVAKRVLESGNPLGIVELELSRARFDPIPYFTVAAEPLEREVLQRCTIGGSENER